MAFDRFTSGTTYENEVQTEYGTPGTFPKAENSQQPESPECTSLIVKSTTKSSLSSLPFELLQLIADDLPNSSEACLILTCKRFYFILGNRSWLNLKKKGRTDPERKACLELMTRDYPSLYPCSACGLSHRWKNHDVRWSARECCWQALCMYQYRGPYQIFFHHVQLAMRAHRISPQHGLSLAGLHSDFNSRRAEAESNDAVHRRSTNTHQIGHPVGPTEFKIVEDRLLVRQKAVQKISLVLENRAYKIWHGYCGQLQDLLKDCGCIHRGPKGDLVQYERVILPLLEKCGKLGLRDTPQILRSRLRRCQFCATEFEASVKISQDETNPLITQPEAYTPIARARTCFLTLTSWKDLGAGLEHTFRV